MSKRESIARYSLIIKKLRSRPATFQEISDYLELESEIQEYNFNISQRTFQRDVNDIRSIYGINIQYDFSRKVYFIDLDQQPEVSERIMEAFDMFNALNVAERLSGSVHFEKRKPQGTENLHGLLHAIKNKLQIKFSYQKFWEDAPTVRTTHAYALKEFKNRWYVLANDLKDNTVKTFALDRLSNLEITKKKFQFPQGFSADEYFKHCFGIEKPMSAQPQEIILSFSPYQGKYIKSLPLHHTQQILIDNDNELQIRLTLFITFDFVMELLSFAHNMKVIKPKSLIKEIKEAHKRAFKLYER